MLNFYNYIFYRLYSSGIRDQKSAAWALWSASAQMGALLLLNIFGALSVVEVVTGRTILESFISLAAYWRYGAFVIIAALVVWMWGSGGTHYKNVIAHFEKADETKEQYRVRGILIWIYVLAWIGVTAYCLFIIRQRNFLILNGGVEN